MTTDDDDGTRDVGCRARVGCAGCGVNILVYLEKLGRGGSKSKQQQNNAFKLYASQKR